MKPRPNLNHRDAEVIYKLVNNALEAIVNGETHRIQDYLLRIHRAARLIRNRRPRYLASGKLRGSR